MIEVASNSREMMSRMFSGEKNQLSPELNLLFSTFLAGVENIRGMVESLPARFSSEMGAYLASLLEHISQMGEAEEEKQAAGMLAERFGVPKFSQAVPVYNLLMQNLLHSERISELSTQEAGKTLRYFQKFMYRLAIVIFDEEISQLKKEVEEEEHAENAFVSEVETDTRSGVQQVVSVSKRGFREKASVLRTKITELTERRNGWLEMVTKLFRNHTETKVMTGKRYEINPAMAL